MAGVYIHIPFCKQICGYCDFYRIAETGMMPEYIKALLKEMSMRGDYLSGESIDTIYLGGGTPSVLSPGQLEMIMQGVKSGFAIDENPEITIEVNPDDITREYLAVLKSLSFNRISMGIQSWNDRYLKMLNRRHDATGAERAVKDVLKAGFVNLSVDLIYGLPGMKNREWESSLEKTFSFDVKHLSAYHLTIEKNTPFYKMLKSGLLKETDEEESNNQFTTLTTMAGTHGFLHYEISNFCRDGWYSRHNTAYWKQVPYIGLGPSAHSFNGYSRQWNVSDVTKYIEAINNGSLDYEREELDFRKKFNEYIMTSLRTMWGIDLEYVESNFEKEGFDYIRNISDRFISYGMMRREKNSLILTDQGVMIADNIISEFMMI
jgi:oxygen-independent coproporphyrinogen-3 oxidase